MGKNEGNSNTRRHVDINGFKGKLKMLYWETLGNGRTEKIVDMNRLRQD